MLGAIVTMSANIQYTYLEAGIHRFNWLNWSASGASEFHDLISQLYNDLPRETEVIRILHDYSCTPLIPFPKVLSSLKLLQHLHPTMNRRIAYLKSDDLLSALIIPAVLISNRTGKRKFFYSNEEEQAIEWLLADD